MSLTAPRTAPSSGAAPSAALTATRLRRPSWRDPRLVVGVVLVTASVVAGAKVVSGFDTTTRHYVAAHTLTAGTQLTAADLQAVDVRLADADVAYLPGSSAIDGLVVTRTVAEGELVPAAAVATGAEVAVQPITLGMTTAEAALVKPGMAVDVWVAFGNPEKSGTFQPPNLSVAGAVVSAVSTGGSAFAMGGDASVTVLVPKSSVASVLDAIENKAAINLVPSVGRAR